MKKDQNVAISSLCVLAPLAAVDCFNRLGITVSEKDLVLSEAYVETGFLHQEKRKRCNFLCWKTPVGDLLRVDLGILLKKEELEEKSEKVNGNVYIHPVVGIGNVYKFEDGSLFTVTRRIPQTKAEWPYQYLVAGAISGIQADQYHSICDTTSFKMKRVA